MALGTLVSVSKSGEAASTPLRCDRISFPGDSSYPTGGTPGFEALVRALLGMSVTIVDVVPGDCGDNKPEYDRANDKLKVRVISTAAEVANTTNLSGVTFNLTVISK